MDLKQKIREIPDWPIKGVNFKDITTLLQDADTFKYVIDEMCKPYLENKPDKIVVIDARGFLLGTTMAYKLGIGVSLVRKEGKLPYKSIKATYEKEYGSDTLTMHEDSIKPGETVAIVDDLIATGGTIAATAQMVEQLGGKIIGISCIIDLVFIGGSDKFKDYILHSLVVYDSE